MRRTHSNLQPIDPSIDTSLDESIVVGRGCVEVPAHRLRTEVRVPREWRGHGAVHVAPAPAEHTAAGANAAIYSCLLLRIIICDSTNRTLRFLIRSLL